MKRGMILPLALVVLTLTACGDFKTDGVRADALPKNVSDPCDRAQDVDPGGNWEVYAGRLGSALNECGDEKAIAVEAYVKTTALLR